MGKAWKVLGIVSVSGISSFRFQFRDCVLLTSAAICNVLKTSRSCHSRSRSRSRFCLDFQGLVHSLSLLHRTIDQEQISYITMSSLRCSDNKSETTTEQTLCPSCPCRVRKCLTGTVPRIWHHYKQLFASDAPMLNIHMPMTAVIHWADDNVTNCLQFRPAKQRFAVTCKGLSTLPELIGESRHLPGVGSNRIYFLYSKIHNDRNWTLHLRK